MDGGLDGVVMEEMVGGGSGTPWFSAIVAVVVGFD